MKIGIIGHGFVGQAVGYGFSGVEQVLIDPKYETKIDNWNYPAFTFITVPTPMGKNGSINAEHIYNTLDLIKKYWHDTVVIIKSTVTPEILTDIGDKYRTLQKVYNPEFLTERSAKDDFVNPNFHVLGSNSNAAISAVKKLYEKYSLCTPCPIYTMTMEEAAYVKYGINTFLATKVIFFNQLKDIIEKQGYDFQTVLNVIADDPRIGKSHTRVPGFDGKPGYGGSCFPKDVSALINNNSFPVLEIVQKSNNSYRENLELDEREKEQNVKFK